MSERVNDELMDRATWVAVVKAYRIAEAALTRLTQRDARPRAPGIAREALSQMRAEVEACQEGSEAHETALRSDLGRRYRVDLCARCRHPGGAHRDHVTEDRHWCTLCDCPGWDERKVLRNQWWSDQMSRQAEALVQGGGRK